MEREVVTVTETTWCCAMISRQQTIGDGCDIEAATLARCATRVRWRTTSALATLGPGVRAHTAAPRTPGRRCGQDGLRAQRVLEISEKVHDWIHGAEEK